MMKKVLAHIGEANDKFAAIPTEEKERMAGLLANFRNQQQQQLLTQALASPQTLSQSELSMQSPHIQEVDELFNELSLA